MLSSAPAANIPNPFPYFHPAVHFVEYSVLAFLSVRALRYKHPCRTFALIAIVTWGIVLLFAASDEWHQTFVAGRTGQGKDVLFDGLYAWLGIGLFSLVIGKIKPNSHLGIIQSRLVRFVFETRRKR